MKKINLTNSHLYIIIILFIHIEVLNGTNNNIVIITRIVIFVSRVKVESRVKMESRVSVESRVLFFTLLAGV